VSLRWHWRTQFDHVVHQADHWLEFFQLRKRIMCQKSQFG
jgi:hypothetical protein